MISKVAFEIKSNIRNWSNQNISFTTSKFMTVNIKIEDANCEIVVESNSEKNNLDYIVLIWEWLVWEDGYFYKPILYTVDNKEKSVEALLTVDCRITDKKWISSAILLCRNQRQISEKIVENYSRIRNQDRREHSMNASMFSAFFYLISEAYANINLEHRLVLLMHICDGIAIEYCNGCKINNSGNINIIIKRLDTVKYKQGAALLGVDSSKAMNALGDTRNELTHYTYKENSLGAYIDNRNTDTDSMVNLYAFYVLEVALRVTVLEIIGIQVSDKIKEYVMDQYLDWIKLEKHLDEDCVLPMNVLRQMLERLQNNELNPKV